VARRLLAPVGAASAAASRMSEGDLSIRLPEGADEFGVLAASFNRMAENLEARMTDLEMSRARERRFVADVAHELRTPVAALVGEASLVHSRLAGPDAGALSPDMTELVEMVIRDTARLRQLVDDLLEISRLDAQAAEVLLEPVDAACFLEQLMAERGWPRYVRLERTLPSNHAFTDKRRLERIVVNLAENALRHGSPPVMISVWTAAGFVYLAVQDEGPGITEEHLPHVFDRFYKADPSRSVSPGSGLGLAIARENARLLGGEITVESGSSGARFLLALPSAPEAEPTNP
jgi:signal transduction histidine kinase